MKRFLFAIAALCIAVSAFAQVEDAYSPEAMRERYDKREVMVRMRDGVSLFTSIYEPKDRSVKHPVLMLRTCYGVGPYGEDSFRSFSGLEPYVDAGYIFVYQDVRGKCMSEGVFEDIRPFIEGKKLSRKESKNVGQTDEASDTYDTVEWLLKNTDNNGCFGQLGTSYPGFYATMGALCGHPAMKAVSPQAPVSNWFLGDDAHHNGALMLAEIVPFQSYFEYSSTNTRFQSADGSSSLRFPDISNTDIYTDWLRMGTYSNICEAFGDSLSFLRIMREHPDWDEYWESHTVTCGHLHDVKPAVMVVGGLFDKEDCYGAFDTYKSIRAQSPVTEAFLVEGPWFHGGWNKGMKPFWGNMYFGEEATSEYYVRNIEYPFFAYYLEGKGEKPSAGARVFDSGSRKWNSYDSWPADCASSVPFYLHSDGTISLSAPSAAGTVGYTSDPSKPVPYSSSIESRVSKDYMISDQRFASQRPDVVCFESPVLSEPLVLAGEVEVELMVDVSSTDADFIVKVVDVFPDDFSWMDEAGVEAPDYPMGGYQLLVRGDVMRGKYRESFAKPVPFVPGEVSKVRFRMTDVSHTFKPGHRLMVQVQSSWFPLVDRNPQTFCNIYTCDGSAYRKAAVSIHCDPAAASLVRLPVVNGPKSL